MNIKVIAYFTNRYYCDLSVRLTDSLHRLGIPYRVMPVHGPKTWGESVCVKPRFILDELKITMDDVFYVDVDSEFKRKPDWEILKGCDFACVEWKRYPTCDPELLTGSMYFANSDRVRGFLEEWDRLTPKYRGTFTPEQRSLAEYLSKPNPLAVKKLPLGWCKIFDDMKSMVSDEETIIEHYQASREYKEIEAKSARKA